MSFMVNQLIGFGAALPNVEKLLDRTAGTNIGNMTLNGGLATAFDGTTAQTALAVAYAGASATNGGFVGKDWGAGVLYLPSKLIVYPTTDEGFCGNDQNITLNYRCSNSSPSDGANGTQVGTSASAADGTTARTVTATDLTTSYRYHWVQITASATPNNLYCAELRIYGLV